MNEAVKHIEQAYGYLSKLSVSGDAVELLALVRVELREAHKLASEHKESEVEAIGQTD